MRPKVLQFDKEAEPMTSDTSSEPQATSGTVAAVVRASDAQPREFLGVPFDLLAIGERTMVTKMRFQAGMTARAHTHPHEQAGYVISGRYRQTVAGASHELGVGDSYAIPGGIEHAMEVLEDGEVIDVFTPPRDEFR
jgi:quercetin dioxygenase-like cupin family protein